jgi:hypothetical protein
MLRPLLAGLTQLVRYIKCRCGLHQWRGCGGNVDSDTTLITLVWWECPHCAASKGKCIFHNEAKLKIENSGCVPKAPVV